MGLALILTSLGIGYQLGTLSNLNSNLAVTPSNDKKECISELKEMAEKAEDETVEDEELEDISDGDLGSISAGLLEPCKLVRLIIHEPIIYFMTLPFNWFRFWLFVQILK